ncbi:cysteine-rich receptor-like protein kinase 20 [Artemisia annua]|uniref:Cysteine-rich receptor-like protein kinase 20 n=1 Tax=Artemisia annua TaxID=35608 RepID=A0A2U1L0Q0_ARTAN|nr:cysteine-rich receptor-like protein kinase 20 [Artemisia annua]
MDILIRGLFLFSPLMLTFYQTTAQDDLWSQYCGASYNDRIDSTYKSDLDNVLNSLAGRNNGFGFYNSTSGQANAAAFCRGDLEPETCHNCVVKASRRLPQYCPNQFDAGIWYEHCLLRYSNEPMGYGVDDSFWINTSTTTVSNSSYDQWKQTIANLLLELRQEAAAGGPLRKYAPGNVTADGLPPIYGYMQCSPDLLSTECDQCLAEATDQTRIYDKSLGIQFYNPSCIVRYEVFKFLNSTCGYMAPEYAMDGLFSTKSDVYSFGVLLLEIVSGQQNNIFRFEDEPQNFLLTVWNLWKENKGEQLIDRCLIQDVPISEALRWINIALLCVQEDPRYRPTMSTVVYMLEGQWSSNFPTPLEPRFSFARLASVIEITTTTSDTTIDTSIEPISSGIGSR